jgi:hypothetical protein
MLFNQWQHSLMLFLYIGSATLEQAADQVQAHYWNTRPAFERMRKR